MAEEITEGMCVRVALSRFHRRPVPSGGKEMASRWARTIGALKLDLDENPLRFGRSKYIDARRMSMWGATPEKGD